MSFRFIAHQRSDRQHLRATISFDLVALLPRFADLILFWCIPMAIFEGPGVDIVILCESKWLTVWTLPPFKYRSQIYLIPGNIF